MTSERKNYDVVVVGAGNAALTAALAAASEGAKVAILEKAPEHLRGGNSYFTGGLFRFAYNGIEDISELLPAITSDEKENIYLTKIISYEDKNLDQKSDDFKSYINKENSNNRNNILKSYDIFLNDKYKVVLNQKTIERVKNFFK